MSKDASSPDAASVNKLDDEINRLIFDHLDHLITLCQASIRRDLLVYNVRVIRYELLKAIRQVAGGSSPGEFELQAGAELMDSSKHDSD
jgi:hypothetical protein